MRRSERGFTLVEVAVAVAILGAGLATLIALQTRMTDNFLRERAMFRATLAAQYLISFIEIQPTPPDVGSSNGDLISALQQNGYFDGLQEAGRIQETMHDWKMDQVVTSVDYGEYQDILRRVEVTIRWSPSDRDQVSLVLFMNTPLKQATGGAS